MMTATAAPAAPGLRLIPDSSLKPRLLVARAVAALCRARLAQLEARAHAKDRPLLDVLRGRRREEEAAESRLRELDYSASAKAPFRPEEADRLLREAFPTSFERLGEAALDREAALHFAEAVEVARARFFARIARGSPLLQDEAARSEERIGFWRTVILPPPA